MIGPQLLYFWVWFPPLAGIVILLLGHDAKKRDFASIIIAFVMLLVALLGAFAPADGGFWSLMIVEMLPGLAIAFRLEPLGILFSLIATGLWVPTVFYAIGYMRANQEPHQTRFFACFPITIGAAVGVAYASNLLTLFLFYEILTFATWPLVAHKRDGKAKTGARIYLALLVGASICLFLPALLWTFIATDTLDFVPGGFLAGRISPELAPVLIFLYIFGIAKAALMPLHRWLPAAMVAPAPVSAVLHAVAIVKAGVFCVLKIILYCFGHAFFLESGAAFWLSLVAGFTILSASLIAMTKDDIKARLAYSTVSQLSYVLLGAVIASSAGILGAGLQIVTHAFGKITLFYGAGAIATAHGKTKISQLDGLAAKMPFTFGAIFLGALCVIGLPPLAGMWTKWYLISGAASAEQYYIIAIFVLSTLLNAWYLPPLFLRAVFLPPKEQQDTGKICEAPLFCLLPLLATAISCVILFFTIGYIVDWLEKLPL